MEIGVDDHSAKGVMNGTTITKVLTLVQDMPTLETIEVKEVSSGPLEQKSTCYKD
jgi:hypothetical protein